MESLSSLIKSFYNDDDIENDTNFYGASFEEMLILRSDDMDKYYKCDFVEEANVFYTRISLKNGKYVHILCVYDSAEDFWKNIIEKHDIKVDWIIDSHKGLGDWFENVPLYRVFLETTKPFLLPKYYFKGKFISHDAPDDFALIHEAKDNWIGTQIYRTPWNQGEFV
jgi:hypothetical protein